MEARAFPETFLEFARVCAIEFLLMAFFNCFIGSAGLEDGALLFEMIDGVPLDSCLDTPFGRLHLSNIEHQFGYINQCAFVHDDNPAPCQPSCQVDEAVENDALTHMLYCHEAMQEDDVHLPLGPAHNTLVLPGWLRERSETLTNADWAMLCEVGVAAAMQGEQERECFFEECEMPVLDLSAPDEGFVW